ncbi:MAG: histidine kinase [Chloroflexota bacterium]
MLTELRSVANFITERAPYPLVIQMLISVVIFATQVSAVETEGIYGWNVWIPIILLGFHLIVCWIVPAQRLTVWFQLVYLLGQCALTAFVNVLLPLPVITYVYLVVVLQAMCLFRVWLWVTFAGLIWLVWNGTFVIASTSVLDWVQGNLNVAFPITCILIAAILYARQNRRSEQMDHILRQMQNHYDALSIKFREVSQLSILEERQRLEQTISHDLRMALAQTEQQVVASINQAQTNIARFQMTIAQTREAASVTIGHLREAVATLRSNEYTPPAPTVSFLSEMAIPKLLPASRASKKLTWILPIVFVSLAFPIALLQQTPAPAVFWKVLAFCGMLVGIYVMTQRFRHPLLVQVGLAAQTITVMGLVLLTQTLPLMLGLLLVMWQIAERFPLGQIITFLTGVHALTVLFVVRILPASGEYVSQLIIFCITCVGVAGFVGLSRRQANRRQEDEQHLVRLTELTRELEEQTAEACMLAVATERARLAREFHDDLGNRLVLINVQLQLVEDLIDDDPQAALDQLVATREQLRVAWSSVLSLIDAKTPIGDQSLACALQQLVERFQVSTHASIVFRLGTLCETVSPAVASAIYRTVQEGLTNACKHAQAQYIDVQVYVKGQSLYAQVWNDTCNIISDPCVTSPVSGFGLAGLRERATLLGGSFEAGPLETGGFSVCVYIPLNEAV